MSDSEPLFNQKDIDDTYGPVGTVDEGGGLSRLKVIDKKKSSDAPGISVFSAKYRSEFDEPVSPLDLTASYQTIFTYSGSGKFVGFVATFSNTNIGVKLTIDSEVIFEYEASQVNDAQFGNPSTLGPGGQSSSGGPMWDQSGRRFGFMSYLPIEYGTDVKIEALEIGATPATYIRSIVNLTKET
jgi:hypothetical protein